MREQIHCTLPFPVSVRRHIVDTDEDEATRGRQERREEERKQERAEKPVLPQDGVRKKLEMAADEGPSMLREKQGQQIAGKTQADEEEKENRCNEK
jgi:hypothetical protein